jgi:tRNA (guanine-N7-)-methyltransferase
MEQYSRMLKEGGIIHLKTDSNFLYRYTKAMIAENRIETFFDTEDLYNSGLNGDILEIRTFYEQQWLSRGLNIKYIRFLCPKNHNWTEPNVEIEKDEYRSFGRDARI